MVAMRCKKCGVENAEHAKFCTACGAPLDAAGAPAAVDVSTDGSSASAGSPRHRGRKVILAALALVLAASAGGAGYYIGVYQPEQERAMQEQALKTEKCDICLAVSAAGWDTSAGASRLALRVQGDTLAGDHIDNIMYVDSAGKGISLLRGSYTISAVGSPIAADGTVYALPDTVAEVEIPAEAKKDETIDASFEYEFELTPVEALNVTDDMLAPAKKYAEGDKDSEADGYGCDAEALVAAATKRRDDAVAAKKAADEAAAKVEQERKAAEEAERAAQEQAAQQQAADDAFAATARKNLFIPDDLQGVTYKRFGSYYWQGAAMEVYPITFYNSNGDAIAQADCTKDGLPATSIMRYIPGDKY